MLLATGVAVIARHPIARAIGTEQDQPTLTPSVVATAPPTASTQAAPAVGALVAPAPTHAPRDPFHALVAAGAAILGPTTPSVAGTSSGGQPAVVPPATWSFTPSTTTPPAAAAAASTPSTSTVAPAAAAPARTAGGTCAGTVHTVVAGDTLWSIAAKAVKSSDTARVNVAWHRIYAANQPPLGSNPSLVPVGTKLCVPSSL